MNFNTQNITLVTLYGYFEDTQSQNPRHIQIPVDPQVQGELKGMLTETVTRLGLPAIEPTMVIFDPAEKYGSEEQLKISLATPYLQGLAAVVALTNLPSDANALTQVAELDYYYAIFTDNQNRHLYAFRRASQFKGVTKSKLAWINGGMLTLLTSHVFRLDIDSTISLQTKMSTSYVQADSSTRQMLANKYCKHRRQTLKALRYLSIT